MRPLSVRPVSIQIATRDDDVFGDVALAPAALTGLSEAQLARAMSSRPPAAHAELAHTAELSAGAATATTFARR